MTVLGALAGTALLIAILTSGVSGSFATNLMPNAKLNLTKTAALTEDTPQVAASGSNVYVVWRSYDSSDQEQARVFFVKSRDSSKTFESAIHFDTPGVLVSEPKLAAVGPHVYVAWGQYDSTTDVTTSYISVSHDYGDTFSEPLKLKQMARLEEIQLAAVGSDVYVGWTADSDPVDGYMTAFYVVKSHDFGFAFSFPVLATGIQPEVNLVEMMADADNLYIAWDGRIDDGTPSNSDPFEILFVRSTISGVVFEAPINLSNNEDLSSGPVLRYSDNNVYVAWLDETEPGNPKVAISANYGGSFDTVRRLPNLAPDHLSQFVDLSADGSNLYAAWHDGNVGSSIQSSADGGVTFSGVTNMTKFCGLMGSNYSVAFLHCIEPLPNGHESTLVRISQEGTILETVVLEESLVIEEIEAAFEGGNIYTVWHLGGDVFFQRFALAPSYGESSVPYLTERMVSISEDLNGLRIQDKDALNATDYYYIQSKFSNPFEETIYLSKVFYVVSVLDRYGIAHYVDANNYGDQTVESGDISDYAMLWFPQAPGPYTVKTFLVSDWDNPQVISNLTTLQVKVNEKIDELEEGERNNRLEVENINTVDGTVKIVFNYCDENPPYSHRAEASLSRGDHVSINAVDAYFVGIKDDKAIFRFDANGGDDFCLL